MRSNGTNPDTYSLRTNRFGRRLGSHQYYNSRESARCGRDFGNHTVIHVALECSLRQDGCWWDTHSLTKKITFGLDELLAWLEARSTVPISCQNQPPWQNKSSGINCFTSLNYTAEKWSFNILKEEGLQGSEGKECSLKRPTQMIT